jgi:hypothetical protein
MKVDVEVRIPYCALETIQNWGDKSGLGQDGFYQTALSLGVQTMQSSLGYLDYLDHHSLQEAARELGDDELSGDMDVAMLVQIAGVAKQELTPAQLVQIILGDEACLGEADLSLHKLGLVLPAHVHKRVLELCQKSGMTPEVFYDMAFAMGLRVMSKTLSPYSLFKPGIVARTLERRWERPSASQQDQTGE